MFRAALCALLALAAATGEATAQVALGDVTLDFTGRAQIQFSTTSVDEDDVTAELRVPTTTFETRRIRLGAEIAFQEWLTAEIEADLGGTGARLSDGYVAVALADALVLTAGQFKKPFGVFELTSSTQVIPIERAVRLRGLGEYLQDHPGEAQHLLEAGRYAGRDIGISVGGAAGALTYSAGVFNGEGANARETMDSKAYAGRVTVGGRGFVVGGAVSRQPMGVPVVSGEEAVGTAWAVDAQYGGFRVPGPRVMAELMAGDAPATVGGDDPDMLGAQAAAGWFVPLTGRVDGIEPVLRASWGDPDRDAADDEGLLVTPGLSFYFTGRNRLMLNADVYVPSQPDLDTQYGLRAQLQVHF